MPHVRNYFMKHYDNLQYSLDQKAGTTNPTGTTDKAKTNKSI